MYDLNTVKDRIKRARKGVKLTQEELAKKMCCNRETVTAWENGRNIPTLDSLFQLCEICQCDFGFIVGEYEQKRREISDVCEVTGLSPGAVNVIRHMVGNGKKGALNETIVNYHFFTLLGLIYRLSKAKKDNLSWSTYIEKAFNSQFGDISEEYVYEAVASNEAAKLIAEVADKLKKEVG